MKMSELYHEKRLELGTHRFEADEIIHFARRFDPQIFHTDPEAAKAALFGGLCASGWHTCAMWMRTFVDFWNAETERLAADGIVPPQLGPSPGFKDLSWYRPVFAGDSITYYVTLTASRSLSSRPGWILNTIVCEGVNQDGLPAVKFESTVLEFA
jgi:acyl dehydratase